MESGEEVMLVDGDQSSVAGIVILEENQSGEMVDKGGKEESEDDALSDISDVKIISGGM